MATRASVPDQLQVVENGTGAPLGQAVQEPVSRSLTEMGRKYSLDVVQQPRRARMCGFGDKDRRPITPPPCVRLIITDITTGKEVDVNEIDHGMYVLNVDLWSADGAREVNLVRHSATSPSISSTVPVSYAQVHEHSTPAFSNILPSGHTNILREAPREPANPQYASNAPPYNQGQGAYNPFPNTPQVNPYAPSQSGQGAYGTSQYNHPSYPASTNGNQNYPPPNGYQAPPQQIYYATGAQIHAQGAQVQGDYKSGIDCAPASQPLPTHSSLTSYGGRPFTPNDLNSHRMPVSSTQPTGMFTRNLIGSLAASAFRLTDPDDRIGIWFVLQDLSVRTEGSFRLRFSFVNVGAPSQSANGTPSNQSSIVNTGKAPVLAACFSDVFTVYSAKKFPGVVESTHLSKCFATQGIKIPIRKDGPSKVVEREEYDED
jgi:hypothetical protein